MIHPADRNPAKKAAKVPIFVWVIILVVGSTGTYYGYKQVKWFSLRKEYQRYVLLKLSINSEYMKDNPGSPTLIPPLSFKQWRFYHDK